MRRLVKDEQHFSVEDQFGARVFLFVLLHALPDLFESTRKRNNSRCMCAAWASWTRAMSFCQAGRKHFSADGHVGAMVLLFVLHRALFDRSASKGTSNNVKSVVRCVCFVDECNALMPDGDDLLYVKHSSVGSHLWESHLGVKRCMVEGQLKASAPLFVLRRALFDPSEPRGSCNNNKVFVHRAVNMDKCNELTQLILFGARLEQFVVLRRALFDHSESTEKRLHQSYVQRVFIMNAGDVPIPDWLVLVCRQAPFATAGLSQTCLCGLGWCCPAGHEGYGPPCIGRLGPNWLGSVA